MKSIALLFLTALPAAAQVNPIGGDAVPSDLPPGLVSAQLLPGWVTDDGSRMTALRIDLEPGWKTYWRSPGDAGVPPRFDWQGSDNLGEVTIHWPRPEVIESGGERTLGYHDRLILPIEVAPKDAAQPSGLTVRVDFGICEDICVPAEVSLQAPAPASTPDPLIQEALDQGPAVATTRPECRIEEIEDGMRVTARFGSDDAPEVAMELPGSPVWVSQPVLAHDGGALTATADFVPESGQPFPLDPAALRLTLISPDAATEFRGCTPAKD